jgi:hypothetical protein
MEEFAQQEQRDAMEQDDREGMVREYLSMLLPENWEKMGIYERQEYFRDAGGVTQPKGVNKRQSVSNIEIWCECFGKRPEDIKPMDSYSIAAIMERLDGWEKTGRRASIPLYGQQRIYTIADKKLSSNCLAQAVIP